MSLSSLVCSFLLTSQWHLLDASPRYTGRPRSRERRVNCSSCVSRCALKDGRRRRGQDSLYRSTRAEGAMQPIAGRGRSFGTARVNPHPLLQPCPLQTLLCSPTDCQLQVSSPTYHALGSRTQSSYASTSPQALTISSYHVSSAHYWPHLSPIPSSLPLQCFTPAASST